MNNIELMNYWKESSDRDYDAMIKIYESKQYTWALFIGHLVIEKLLKALYAKSNKGAPYAPKSHDLTFLASKIDLKLTEKQEELLNTITRFNIDGRYDDYKNNFYKLCNEEYTKMSINKINNVRNWLLQIIKDENKDEDKSKNESES